MAAQGWGIWIQSMEGAVKFSFLKRGRYAKLAQNLIHIYFLSTLWKSCFLLK